MVAGPAKKTHVWPGVHGDGLAHPEPGEVPFKGRPSLSGQGLSDWGCAAPSKEQGNAKVIGHTMEVNHTEFSSPVDLGLALLMQD